ncbi:MAG: HAMP domain-containing protein [Peptococcaceae bacterium]|nr:HAMP domain-containing protein [Peptococcaceae bacterium]
MSVKLRLTLLFTGVLGLTLVIFGLLVYFTMYRALSLEVDRGISAMAASVVKSIKVSKSFFDLHQIILPDVDVFSSPGTYLQVVDTGGRLVARSGNLGPQSLPMSEDTLRTAAGGRGFFENVRYGRQAIRIYNQPLVLDEQVIGILQVGRSLSQVDMVLSRLRLMIFLGGLVTVLSAGLLGWSLARVALKPIEKIIEAAASIQRGSDLKKRIDYRGPKDELHTLAGTLNEMLERLENMYRQLEEINESQKRFVADASHELRTPLTTIRGNAELLIRMGDCDPAVRSEALADIAGEAERLTGLVSNLLCLARADAGQGVETGRIPLAGLMGRVVQGMKFLTRREIIVQGVEGLPEDLLVDVNPDLIIQAVNILLDNALKYTPEEGEIRLGVVLGEAALGLGEEGFPEGTEPIRIKPGFVAIYVRDGGPGIPEEERREIFKRFYRGKAVRGTSGSGLGLSIAQWIVQKHGGRIELASRPGAGSLFALVLPLAGSAWPAAF